MISMKFNLLVAIYSFIFLTSIIVIVMYCEGDSLVLTASRV